jgi:hypothetical protein
LPDTNTTVPVSRPRGRTSTPEGRARERGPLHADDRSPDTALDPTPGDSAAVAATCERMRRMQKVAEMVGLPAPLGGAPTSGVGRSSCGSSRSIERGVRRLIHTGVLGRASYSSQVPGFGAPHGMRRNMVSSSRLRSARANLAGRTGAPQAHSEGDRRCRSAEPAGRRPCGPSRLRPTRRCKRWRVQDGAGTFGVGLEHRRSRDGDRVPS